MGAIGPWQIALVVILAVLLLGGRGKISAIMGDFAKGIKSFRNEMNSDDKALEDDKTMKAKAEMKSAEEEPVSKD